MPVISVIIRGIVAYFTLLLFCRIMGSRQVSQLSHFDYVVGITIGSIAATMTVEKDTMLFDGFLGLVVWTTLTVLIGILGLKNIPLRKILEGQPTLVIQNGKILEHNLSKIRYNIDDIMMELRAKDIFNLEEIEFAVLEHNGKLSVLKKSQYEPVTPHNLHLPTKYRGLSSVLISDGQVIEENLLKNKLTLEWLFNELRIKGIENHKDDFPCCSEYTGAALCG